MRRTIRAFLLTLTLLACLGGTGPLVSGTASANEEMDDCLNAGHGAIFCLWRVYMCRILTRCGGDFLW